MQWEESGDLWERKGQYTLGDRMRRRFWERMTTWLHGLGAVKPSSLLLPVSLSWF